MAVVSLSNNRKDLWEAFSEGHRRATCEIKSSFIIFPLLPDRARGRVLGGRNGGDAGRAAALPRGEEGGLPPAGGHNQKVGVTSASAFSKQLRQPTINLGYIINIGDW